MRMPATTSCAQRNKHMESPEQIEQIRARMREALAGTKRLDAQQSIDVCRGMEVRRTKGGTPVIRLHYSVYHERDPKLNPEWRAREKRKYTSKAAWDREMEIIDDAGGGELVFADTLTAYWNKIVITDPTWRPHPKWPVIGGFDHGKTNPTVLLRCYSDYEGTLYVCGEYYQPGMEVWEHASRLREMPDIRKLRAVYADPTIFDATMQQSNQPSRPGKAAERAKSINDLYYEGGIGLFSPFGGDRSDISFAARLNKHWSNLDQRDPSVKIVCRNYAEKPVPGLHGWDCPNLLWELMRTRRVRLTAQQQLTRNASEAIVDKDNHARDACKYIIMSSPEAAQKTWREAFQEQEAQFFVEEGDLTSSYIRYKQREAEQEVKSRPVRIGRYVPRPRTRRW